MTWPVKVRWFLKDDADFLCNRNKYSQTLTVPQYNQRRLWSCTLRLRLSVNSSWDAAACALQQNALRSFGVTPNSWYWSIPRVKRSLAVNPLRGHDYRTDLDSDFTKCKREWITLRGHREQCHRAALIHRSFVLFILLQTIGVRWGVRRRWQTW